MASKLIEITTKKQFDDMISSYRCPILVVFSASWCQPCNLLQIQIEDTITPGLEIVAVRIDIENENTQDIVSRHEIEAIPSVFLYNLGDIMEDKDAYFQGNSSDALSRMFQVANKLFLQIKFQSSL